MTIVYGDFSNETANNATADWSDLWGVAVSAVSIRGKVSEWIRENRDAWPVRATTLRS